MAQSQTRTASAAGPKFRRSGNFFFLRCFGFTGKRKTNFKKKSPTDAVTYRTKTSHWFGISKKKYAAVEKTDRCDPPLLKPSWTVPASIDESKLTISSNFQNKLCKDVEDEGKCQNPLFPGRSSEMIETPEKISKSAPVIAADHARSIFLPLPPSQGKQATVAKTNSRVHRKSEAISERRVDPSVGFLIVTLNLVIMLVWGKACAILCASAFLYIVPRFRTSVQAFSGRKERRSGPIAVSPNRKSDDWTVKSKVVFDGFLERNRRSSSGHR